MKPAYRIPSMAEIAQVKRNGFKVISTFAGAGGSSLGYRMAGFDVLWANEFIPAARDVYAANAAPGTRVDDRDIRQIDPLVVLEELGLEPGELDVLDGSPPCASFSMAGKRDQHWGASKKYSDTTQRTDDLFHEYIRFLRAMQPKTFVAENVYGLVRGAAKGMFLEFLREMKGCGYRVIAPLVDAQWLGVPQSRHRLVFLGVREDLGVDPRPPAPFAYQHTVRDALEGVAGGVEPEASIEGKAIGKAWQTLAPGGYHFKYRQLIRAAWNEPCPCVTGTGAEHHGKSSVTHPAECRKFSIAELKRLSAFPDDFVLTGSYAQQWERLGRAVPPLMMRAIALEVAAVLRKAKKSRRAA